MKKDRPDPRSSIESAINGSGDIKSPRQFMDLVKQFPTDPDLHRAFADWLVQNEKPASATQTYKRTVNLYLGSGKLLQAISAKLMQWRLTEPTPQDLSAFHSQLQKSALDNTPVNNFFACLGAPEMAALLPAMTVEKIPPGQTVSKFGDVENHLFFVVSGAILNTCLLPLGEGETDTAGDAATMDKNTFFGEILPFEQETISECYNKTMLPAELIRVPKNRLYQLCRKYPDMRRAVERLYATRDPSADKNTPGGLRKGGRHDIFLKLSVHIEPDKGGTRSAGYEGHSIDIGVGGISVVLKNPGHENFSTEILDKNVKINISLPDETVEMVVTGTIVWARPVEFEGEAHTAAGIRFQEMTPQMSGYLVVFTEIVKGMSTRGDTPGAHAK